MLPQLWLATPAGYGVLTTTGRKTGRPRHKCVRVIQRGDRVSRCTATVPYRRDQSYCGSGLGAQHLGQCQRAVTDPRWRLRHRELLCSAVFPTDYGECALHLRGLPARTKVQELHRYWFETGIPIAIDLEEIRL